MDPGLQLLLDGPADDELEVLVRLDRPDLVPPELRVVAQFGDVASARLRRADIERVRRHERVTSMKAPVVLAPVGRPAPPPRPSSLAVSRWEDERRPDDPATGRGIIVAAIDWGCAVDHPDFRHDDGRTRLLALWDQSAPEHRRRRNRYGYGVVHMAADIDTALRGPRPDLALGYDWAGSDRDGEGAHGSHVLSIAAGNGRSGGPVGVAPMADLLFVQMADRRHGGSANLGTSVAVVDALDWILRMAQGRPVCVNLSMGRCMGPHDGSTLVELALDAALNARPGLAICFSGGNYYGREGHSHGQLRPGETVVVPIVVDPADITPNELEVWYSGRDVMSVEVISPTGERSKRTGLDDQATIRIGGRDACRVFNRARDPNNLDNEIAVYLLRDAPAGTWELVLTADDVIDGRYWCWIERDAACPECQARFDGDFVDRRMTTGSICNGTRTIAVGAYDGHDPGRRLAPFSSSGPTRDGRVKPDLVAPGVDVLAARSTRPGAAEPVGYVVRKSGTSMAAPHVTGTLALMFEVAARPLPIGDTRNLLLRSCAEPAADDAAGSEPSRIGNGFLDTAAAVRLTRASTRQPAGRMGGSVHGFGEGGTVMTGASVDGAGLVELGEAAVAAGGGSLLTRLMEALGPEVPAGLLDGGGRRQAALLFDAFGGRRAVPGTDRLTQVFDVVAVPGRPPRAHLRAGDLLVRRAIGHGRSGHIALLAGPVVVGVEQARASGWQLENSRRGGYALVVEDGYRPRRAADRFARRVLDPTGRVPLDTLVLRIRPRPLQPAVEQVGRAGPGVALPPAPVAGAPAAPAAPPPPDSTSADVFVAAHRSRWCSPGDAGSATCRRIRPPRAIRRVVIHALAVPTTRRRTGAQAVVLGWQRAGRTASAHYIVDRDGTTTQMVREADVAFHAGAANGDSIGIEHADVCNDPAPFTRALYERSAALVRDIARRNGFPIRVIEVDTTDPARATVSGHSHVSGPGGHGDPGPYWDWRYYALLLGWDGVTESTRPLREAWTTTDRSVVTRPGGWTTVRRRAIADDRCASRSDPYGASYWQARPDPTGPPVVFTLPVPALGTYQLSLWWPRVKGANPATQVEVEALAGAAVTVAVDQRSNHGRWVDVGSPFTVRALPAQVLLRISRNSPSPGLIVVDGVRLLRIR